MRLLALLVAFIVVPIAELYVIVRVGVAIGLLPTIGLLLLDSVLGTVLLRSQGRAVWRRFSATMADGRVPHREILDGVLVILGGALLLTPGFITDVFGAAFLIPPSRAIVRRVLAGALRRRAVAGLAAAAGAGAGAAAGRRGGRPGDVDGGAFDVEGRAHDVDGRAYDVEGSAYEVDGRADGLDGDPSGPSGGRSGTAGGAAGRRRPRLGR